MNRILLALLCAGLAFPALGQYGSSTGSYGSVGFGPIQSAGQFGAVGDGVTDDTKALQAALYSQKPVWLDPTKVYVCSNLFATNYSCLKSAGAVIQLRPDCTNSLLRCINTTNNDGYPGPIWAATNASFEGIIFDGTNQLQYSSKSSIPVNYRQGVAAWGQRNYFINCECRNFDGYAWQISGYENQDPTSSAKSTFLDCIGFNSYAGMFFDSGTYGNNGVNFETSEYLRPTACFCSSNYYNFMVNAGNVSLANCGANGGGYGFYQVGGYNNGHGNWTGGTMNHNQFAAVDFEGTGVGFLFQNVDMYASPGIRMSTSTGITFQHCSLGNTPLFLYSATGPGMPVTGQKTHNVLIDCDYQGNWASIVQTNDGSLWFQNNYSIDREGDSDGSWPGENTTNNWWQSIVPGVVAVWDFARATNAAASGGNPVSYTKDLTPYNNYLVNNNPGAANWTNAWTNATLEFPPGLGYVQFISNANSFLQTPNASTSWTNATVFAVLRLKFATNAAIWDGTVGGAGRNFLTEIGGQNGTIALQAGDGVGTISGFILSNVWQYVVVHYDTNAAFIMTNEVKVVTGTMGSAASNPSWGQPIIGINSGVTVPGTFDMGYMLISTNNFATNQAVIHNVGRQFWNWFRIPNYQPSS